MVLQLNWPRNQGYNHKNSAPIYFQFRVAVGRYYIDTLPCSGLLDIAWMQNLVYLRCFGEYWGWVSVVSVSDHFSSMTMTDILSAHIIVGELLLETNLKCEEIINFYPYFCMVWFVFRTSLVFRILESNGFALVGCQNENVFLLTFPS